jgi:TrpR-related protein YerC/YecD
MAVFRFDKNSNDLFSAILALKSVKEAESFFRDLCTVQELTEMIDRWQIVKLLRAGRTQRAIAEELNVSVTTVSRVSNWFYNGTGGYNLILNRLHHNSLPSKKSLK